MCSSSYTGFNQSSATRSTQLLMVCRLNCTPARFHSCSCRYNEAVDALPKDQRAGCAAPEGLDNASSGLSRNWQGCHRKNGVNSVWPGPSR